ncbi:MAG: flagellar assembly protein FliW [Fibrobacteres bacterium]|nr:flagellar assembly protein FliW [Fibrobacterota bacterium]
MSDFFSNIVFEKDDVITFPDGIPGFDGLTDFVLVRIPDQEPFEWLVCTQNPLIRFAVVNPLHILPDYDPKISKEQLSPLAIETPDDLLIYVIITLKPILTESTANCIGPVFINRKKKLGRQIVIDGDRYSVQQPLVGGA